MSAEEFWKDDPQLFMSYRKAYIEKKKREMEEYDYKSWLQGHYIYNGNSRIGNRICQTIANGFQGFGEHPKFDKTDFGSYPELPYNELKNKEPKKEETEYKKYQNSLIYFGSIKKIYLEKQLKGE